MSRWLRRTVTVLLAFATAVILLVIGLGWFIAPRDDLKKTDAIVVVSGGETATRADAGIRLWKDGWGRTLVFAGAAADRGTSNAKVMQQRAISQGVPLAATIVEEQSRTTNENARFLKPVFEAQDIRSAILVTSPYHARRTTVTFRREFGKGYEFRIYPASDSRWARSSWWQDAGTIRLTVSEAGKTFYAAFLR
ncbi:MAG TPA: YdcF family protein [Patescibacteria group bacterium]|jgi:uncharacterized SAM-binding protein YcdF (DUF218 family)